MIELAKNKAMNVDIYQAANDGYIVRVGCETFIFKRTPEDIKKLMVELEAYLLNPKHYLKFFHREKSQINEGCDRLAPHQPEEVPPIDFDPNIQYTTSPDEMANRLMREHGGSERDPRT